MRTQTLMFTCIPKLRAGTRLQLSVLLSPRLWTDEGLPNPTLAQFTDLLDWPATIPDFRVQFDPGPTVPAVRVGAGTRLDLWQGIFKGTTPLDPHKFDKLDDRKVRSYPVRNVMSFVKALYQKLATTNPQDFPAFQALLSELQLLATLDPRGVDRERQLIQEFESRFDGKAVPPGPPDPATDFLQVRLFHRPRSPILFGGMPLPRYDFHDMLGAFGEYSQLLRWLGIVHDLEFVLPAIPSGGKVRVLAAWNPDQPNGPTFKTENRSPWTRYVLTPDLFLPAPRAVAPELHDGKLMLNDASRYEVVQVDPDGAAVKLMDLANNLVRSRLPKHKAADTPDLYSVASLRAGGLSVARVGRALRMVQSFERQTTLNDGFVAAVDPIFDAEDLTRGYVVDVWDGSAASWYSLMRRKGKLEFLDLGITELMEEEGATTTGTTSAVDGSSPDLYLQESLFLWQGWSLGAPRPGQVVGTDSFPAPYVNDTGPDQRLRTTFTIVPGTLPKLRYGRPYRIRARAKDVAGSAAPFGPPAAPDFANATPEITYARFEPVPQPTVVKRKPSTEAESLERIVIRSNYDTLPDPNMRSERHIAPPQTSQLMAEQHGLFDLPGGGLDPAAYGLVKSLDKTFLDGGTPDVQYPDTRYYDQDQLEVPYLPDPFARGASLRVLPGTPADKVWQATPLHSQSFGYAAGLTWPGARPFRLVMVEGDPAGGPVWDDATRALTIRVPKAEVVRIRLSSYLDDTDLVAMGIWRWILEAGLSAAQVALLRGFAIRGLHWMLTPHRTLTLVHAVRQPLVQPAWGNPTSSRGLGKTVHRLTDTMPINGNSTIRLDVLADWQEPIDALADPKWEWVPGKAKAFEVAIDPGDPIAIIRHEQDFGDTKHRVVNFAAVATTRFADYFAKRQTVVLTNLVAVALAVPPVAESSEQVKSADGLVLYTRGVDYAIDYAAGTLARVAGSAIGSGATVKVDYVEGPITRETPAKATLHVLNSARPAAPRVLYVVPTFGWDGPKKTGKVITSKRAGGGLRVYLERPWWSSGESELLGAVLMTVSQSRFSKVGDLLVAPQVPDSLKPYVTQWGMDPVFGSTPVDPFPTQTHFKQTAAKGNNLTLDEVAGALVSVAGYEVGYDESRGLWYADIEIDPEEAYYPFIRLALARYQPFSVPNAHLSRVILAEFAQLAPDRAVGIGEGAQTDVVNVSVSGTRYQSVKGVAGAAVVTVGVEIRQPGVDGDIGWIPDGDPVSLATVNLKSGGQIWAGPITLPGPRGSQPFRLVIREYERFIGPPGTGFVSFPAPRLVFADAIILE